MLTLTREWLDTIHEYNIYLISKNGIIPIDLVNVFTDPAEQIDTIIKLCKSWKPYGKIIIWCDYVRIDFDEFYNGKWRLI